MREEGRGDTMRQPGGALEEAARDVLYQLAILELLDAGATGAGVRRGLEARELPGDGALLSGALRRLERQGYLRRGGAPGAPYTVTAAGRQARERIAADYRRLLRRADGGTDAPAPDGAARAALAVERQELERLRSEFLATVSHELRTPLTLIRTSIGLLLDSDPDPAMRARLLRNIRQSADRMHALVTDLLDLARFRHGRAELQLRRVDLGELVDGAAALLRPLLDAKGQALELAIPAPAPRVLGDHRRLERVLLNLLANASTFSPPGARVRITVAAEAGGATVAVADTGPGIAPEAQARLWERFYTERTSSSGHNIGAGLGLPIARGIVEAHGGRIWVESAVGRGSTFAFALPAEPPLAEEPE